MDKLRRALNGNDQSDEESGNIVQVMENNTLSWSTRIKCFAVCFVIGVLFSFLGTFAFFLGGIQMYSVFYTLGTLISIMSTLFLCGPVKQIKRMFVPTRYIATIMVIVSIVLTLFSAFYLKNAGLTLLFIIIQYMAKTWYSLSYIPYARDAVKKTVESCIV